METDPRAIVDRINAGVVCVDRELAIVEWNVFMAAATGRPAADVVGTPLLAVIPDLPQQWLAWKIRTVLQLGTHAFSSWRQRPWVFKMPHSRPLTGGIDHMHQDLVFLPIKDGGGEVTGVCIVISDVTDTAVAERERNRLEAELRLASKLEAVGQLAAGIAHEMNTPLQFLNDNVEFLRGAFADLAALVETYRRVAPPSDELRAAEDRADLAFLVDNVPAACERTVEGLDRLQRLVRSMKDFREPDAGFTGADLNRGIEATLEVARRQFARDIAVTCELAPLPPVRCNLGEVNQALLALVINAADAIAAHRPSGGAIAITSRADGDSVVISIADDGGGIAEAIRGRVFDPFFTTKPVGSGTGQGLHTARAIVVARHGGALWFDSVAERGTTFHLRLPIDGAHTATR